MEFRVELLDDAELLDDFDVHDRLAVGLPPALPHLVLSEQGRAGRARQIFADPSCDGWAEVDVD